MSYPLIFGEILFDQFEDGSQVLGGAPFNVAWHLQGLGLNPKILSGVGNDVFGDEILAAAHGWNMDTALIQQSDSYSTGTVQVRLESGQPTFDIVSDVAYDHISPGSLQNDLTLEPPGIFYHGSLAARASESRQTLLNIRENMVCPVFIDINLRPPWTDLSLVDMLIHKTTWLKLNKDELNELVGSNANSVSDLQTQAAILLKKYRLKAIIVTLGAGGAFILDSDNCYQSKPSRVDNMVDAVGAGDGFSAVTITGLLKQWDYPLILERASEFAARICEQRGAISRDIDFYQRFLSQWDQCQS